MQQFLTGRNVILGPGSFLSGHVRGGDTLVLISLVSGPEEKGASKQRSGKGAIRKRISLQKPRWEKNKINNHALIP